VALELELYFILIQGGLPMTFPEIVKTTLWDIIDEMSRSLSSFVKIQIRILSANANLILRK